MEDCLADYTRIEILDDCICRKCSMVATHRRLVAEVERISIPASTTASSPSSNPGASSSSVSSSQKKKAREIRKLEARVKAAIEEGRIEDDIKGVKMEKVYSRCSTKQSMIARVRSPQTSTLNLTCN